MILIFNFKGDNTNFEKTKHLKRNQIDTIMFNEDITED